MDQSVPPWMGSGVHMIGVPPTAPWQSTLLKGCSLPAPAALPEDLLYSSQNKALTYTSNVQGKWEVLQNNSPTHQSALSQ